MKKLFLFLCLSPRILSAQYAWVQGAAPGMPLSFTMDENGKVYAALHIDHLNYQSMLAESNDGGKNFSLIENTNYPMSEVPAHVHYHNGKLLLAGNTLSVSTDQAQSWSVSNSGLHQFASPGAMTSVSNTIFLTASNTFTQPAYRELYISTNDGASWTSITTNGFTDPNVLFSAIVSKGSRLIATMKSDNPQGAGVYYSDDGGSNWTRANMNAGGDFFNWSSFAHGHGNEIFVSGYHLSPALPPIYKSTDNGINWAQISHTGLEKFWVGGGFFKSRENFLIGGTQSSPIGNFKTMFRSESFASLKETDQNQHSIYPNPGQGSFILSTGLSGTCRVAVFALQGQCVYEQHLQSHNNTLEIDLSSQPDGLYIVSLQNETTKWQDKIILQRGQ